MLLDPSDGVLEPLDLPVFVFELVVELLSFTELFLELLEPEIFLFSVVPSV